MTLVEFHSHTRTFALLLLPFRPEHGCVMDHEVEPLLRAPPPRARRWWMRGVALATPVAVVFVTLAALMLVRPPSARFSHSSPILPFFSLGVTPRDARADPDVPSLPLSLFPRDRPIAAFDAPPSSPSASRRTPARPRSVTRRIVAP